MPDFFAVTVSQVNRRLAMLVKGDKALNDLYVEGEISNYTLHAASGHIYFTLKDSTASIKCVMFSSYAERLTFAPQSGISVMVRGKVGVYERDGANQIYVTEILPQGQGELYLAFEKAKQELKAGGYFEQKRKIPPQPKKICLITSEKGAALQDILNIISRRSPITTVLIIPVTVQGVTAPQSLINALNKAQDTDCDLIIIGRGGGSADDLSCFNDVDYAKTLFASKIPTISAVGHETDFTISDFVADLRAPTPSAAAELATAVTCEDLLGIINQKLARASDLLHQRLEGCMQRLDMVQKSIMLLKPSERLNNYSERLSLLNSKITSGVKNNIEKYDLQLTKKSEYISALNPINILNRGYSAVSGKDGIITSVEKVKVGDKVKIIMSDGILDAEITDKSTERKLDL